MSPTLPSLRFPNNLLQKNNNKKTHMHTVKLAHNHTQPMFRNSAPPRLRAAPRVSHVFLAAGSVPVRVW